jgi:hypothetical protein
MFNWKDWFDTQDNINAIKSRLISIINNEELEPHIYYFDGPPSTGKKTFMHILHNLIPNTSVKYVYDYSTDFIEPHIHTYFVINNLIHPIPDNIPYTKIFFWKQFTNTNRNFNKLRIKSESWIESIADTLRSDIGLPVLSIPCPSPLSRQSSCGSCDSYCAFVTSLPSPKYIK